MDNSNNIPALLNKLCEELTLKQDAIKPAEAYELALSYMTSINEQHSIPDEKILCQKIHSRLSTVSGRDADKFNELFAKLKNTFVLKQPVSVLSLLLALSEAPQTTNSTQQLFPVPNLSVINSAAAFTGASSSKSTVGSASWGVNTPKQQNSNPSISTNNSNLVIATQSCNHANEPACVRDAVLAATGVKARSSCNWSRPVQVLYSRIAHLGFLHDKLKDFIDPASVFTPQGLMVEGLVAAIREELTEYYRSVALLQSQVCESDGGGGTLRRVSVWAQDPLHRLHWLATIVHSVQHKRGGELATCVHRYVHHGDERVSALARRLLTSLTYPLLLMLTRWLLHGEIDDPYHEFFIESRNGVPIDRMWHDKYRVREWMVPSFMCREQAAQILATGKSVVFMREACADLPDQCDTSPDHAIHLQSLLAAHTRTGSSNSEVAWWEAEGLREGVETAHLMASQRLLAALTTHHHLLDHLAAHRRYLLLSQGDFVHHLMTLLQDELSKPATSLYVHNLTCTLEAAVRATNAQYEPQHVLSRLHVNLYPNCDGREDSGWDVFALQYRVDGPLGTLFPATCAARYRALFTQLWRVKRIEYALHDAWRDHTILQKRLKAMPEVWSLMRRVSCLRAEALRLCGALQDASCEGAEPAWVELLSAASEGHHLDRLLQLHHNALDRHSIHAMIHHSTQELQSYLGNVLNETLALRSFETTLHTGINTELERRERYEALKAERAARNEFAITCPDEAQDKERRKIFIQFLASRKADLNVWARSYRGHVTTLILKLALHQEVSLQTLAFRLDYSDFYKRGDAKLHEPLTYQHKRLSEMGLHLAKTRLLDHTKRK
ncbi:gamma-tubulin complex component 3-like isoform X1 [Pieris brassicae]|uniref:Gamma-tubulin complex component n=1 Tax=Pieris brassicae TaxID=7116 RepID=A0A9P0TLK1_PIEBR|nr:gamma-tubulin complex component 3-like isoform X1 [Pieris brassicae]CAH4030729.1 unnamed protein product [Pieris brassicae]